MSFVIRILLIFIALFLVAGLAEADHLVGHSENKSTYKKSEKQKYKEILNRNKKILAAYNELKEKAGQVWGEGAAVVPDSTLDVTYRNNLKQRSIVDYENGTVKVELAVKPYKAKNSKAIKNELANAVEQTLLQGPDDRSIIEIAKNPEPPKSEKPPVLEGLVANADGSPLKPEDMEDYKKIKARSMIIKPITGNDGKKRFVVSTQFNLVPDHIKKRAVKFRKAVEQYALKHKIPTPLIYAIIETESCFNPRAKSPVPAFGLMQLVPGTGARDAYKYLFRKDIVVKEHYLYKPTENIELGVAYLHLLYFRYLRHIKDPASRQWATIAAYNTGVRNVIKSFAGEYTKTNYSSRLVWKKRALKEINSMMPEQVYRHLRQFLPAAETRDYMKKVRERMGKYNT